MFHWLLVSMFVGAYLSAEGERWRLLYVTLGYTMAGLVGFRLVWGLVGTRHARFCSFVRGPAAVTRVNFSRTRWWRWSSSMLPAWSSQAGCIERISSGPW
jgi:cytochrome b